MQVLLLGNQCHNHLKYDNQIYSDTISCYIETYVIKRICNMLALFIFIHIYFVYLCFIIFQLNFDTVYFRMINKNITLTMQWYTESAYIVKRIGNHFCSCWATAMMYVLLCFLIYLFLELCYFPSADIVFNLLCVCAVVYWKILQVQACGGNCLELTSRP